LARGLLPRAVLPGDALGATPERRRLAEALELGKALLETHGRLTDACGAAGQGPPAGTCRHYSAIAAQPRGRCRGAADLTRAGRSARVGVTPASTNPPPETRGSIRAHLGRPDRESGVRRI